MSLTGCHLPRFIPKATDVAAHQQPFRKETWYRKEITTYSPYLPLHDPMSATPASSMSLRRRSYQGSSVDFCNPHMLTAIQRLNLQGKTRGQFSTARGVRPGCPASGFLFAMAFDATFRRLQDSIIPRNPGRPRFSSTLSVCLCR